jgi:hypothetical protein
MSFCLLLINIYSKTCSEFLFWLSFSVVVKSQPAFKLILETLRLSEIFTEIICNFLYYATSNLKRVSGWILEGVYIEASRKFISNLLHKKAARHF